MNETERSKMLGNMEIRKLVIKLSIPAIAAMAFNALYNLVDTFFVARGASQTAIGALSIAYPIQMIILAIGLMIGIGSSSVFSRAYGREDKKTMRSAVNNAFIFNLVVSLLISIIAYIFLEDLLVLFGASASNIGYARDYLVVIIFALIPFSMSIVFNNLTRAEGRPNVAMFSMIIGALTNIILDPIFIFDWGLGLGVSGAAWATFVGKGLSFLYVFYMAMRPESALNIHFKTLHQIDVKMIFEMITVGLPSFMRVSLGGFLIIIVNNLINYYAPNDPAMYISIYGVINRLLRFTLMPGFGLVQGIVPIVGFNFGAMFYQRLKLAITFTVKLLLGYFIFIFLMVLLFAEALFGIFSPEQDALFITEGARAFRIVAAGFAFITFQVLMSSVYQAMGYPIRAFILALSRRFILFIPFALLLTSLVGLDGIWWTFFVADIFAGTIAFLMFANEMRKFNRLIAA